MRYARTTPTGRRLIAEPVSQSEPDMDRLIALVLHLADRLHDQTASVADSTTRTSNHDDDRRHEDPDRPG